jgi:hypothetical protein
MLPPVEQAVLENNPDFAVLYSKLTASVLNPDGSTKTDPAAKERRVVSEVRSRGAAIASAAIQITIAQLTN